MALKTILHSTYPVDIKENIRMIGHKNGNVWNIILLLLFVNLVVIF